jgi:LPS export ABC transporter protein LptC
LSGRSILSLVFLGAAALGAWSLQNALQDTPEEDSGGEAEVAGFYMINASFVSPGADGRPLYRLNAATMRHSVSSNRIDMEDVRIEYDQAAESPWVVTAPHGEIQVDWQTLRLDGGVRMVFEDGDAPPIVLDTPDVLLEASEHRASTDSDVSLNRGEHHLTATGMSVDLKGGLVRLESRVNGRFLP